MTIRPLGPAEWNTRSDPAERVRQSAPNGLAVSFQVHGGRISNLEVKDGWTGDTAMAMPAVTAAAVTALIDVLCDLTRQTF
ncbi:MAG: hypothetical protein KDB72_02870 [Mycobacterium sp.]|nr:hypothetical protein [Mycobacterium sp.]